MIVVLSALLVVCLVICNLRVRLHREYQRELADERDTFRNNLRLSTAECVGLSDQVAGLTEKVKNQAGVITHLEKLQVQQRVDRNDLAQKSFALDQALSRERRLEHRLKEVRRVADGLPPPGCVGEFGQIAKSFIFHKGTPDHGEETRTEARTQGTEEAQDAEG